MILGTSFFSKAQKSFSIEGKELILNFARNARNNLCLNTILPVTNNQSFEIDSLKSEMNYEVFLHITGENRDAHHGAKLTGASASGRLEFVDKEETIIPGGKIITLVQFDSEKELKVESYYEFNNLSPVVRRYTVVTNLGKESIGIDYLSSAIMHNFLNVHEVNPQENLRIHFAYNSWKQECQWKTAKPSELGWENTGGFNLNGIFFTNLGSLSTIKYLPMGMVENVKSNITWFWQVEHNGSWHWELSTNNQKQTTYLYIGGPDEEHHQAWKNLKPGESYKTVPVAIGCVQGGFEKAVEALTIYRRKVILRRDIDNSLCPVIFNDYMNCLHGNPTTEKEIPLIDAAAKAGCDYFVIDAGWYAEQNESWWDAVGLWQPSKTRFSEGLPDLLHKIRQKGMKPGLWLEIEVAGINSPLKEKPDSWFMIRHGKRIIDNGRYLLDFRNPEVIAHADEVIDRLVKNYGASYIKMDYNVNALIGTENGADSYGQGLLEHNRALVRWYKSISDRHPDLIVENCASGGCRMDYAMLSETHIQSSSDQTDYRKYPAILTGALAAVLPEQLAVWSYPLSNSTAKEASFNMVNAMLCRIHQSGHLANLPKESLKQVERGIEVYKSKIAPVICQAIPFFPLGMPSLDDSKTPVSVGLRLKDKEFIAVWRLNGNNNVLIPTNFPKKVNLIYPTNLGIKISTNTNNINLVFPSEYMAAIVEVIKE